MKDWIAKLLSDCGDASAKRFVLIAGGLSLSLSSIILALAAVYGKDVSNALNAVTWPLAAMAGASYIGGKAVEAKSV